MSDALLRRQLAQKALDGAALARRTAEIPAAAPVSPFDAAEKLGISVRFVSISMEGMYRRGARPDILVSSLRPLARRIFTCAHEIGHHYFGHGSTIDELYDEISYYGGQPDDEFLVDAFAGFFLMPPVGLRGALSRRGFDPSRLSPPQAYRLACAFGVGYETIVTQLSAGMGLIPRAKAVELRRVPVERIRKEFTSGTSSGGLVVIDAMFEAQTIDVEVGFQLLLPSDVTFQGSCLGNVQALDSGEWLVEAVRPGIGRLVSGSRSWSAFVRVMNQRYIGLAQYRHLEPADE